MEMETEDAAAEFERLQQGARACGSGWRKSGNSRRSEERPQRLAG